MNTTKTSEYDPKAKYMLMYATDLTKPPGQSPPEFVQFRSFLRLLWFVVRHKDARAAVFADRYKLATIARSK